MNKDSSLLIRVSKELKASFKDVARKEGYGASSLIEAFMKDVVKKGKVPLHLRPYLSRRQKPAVTLPRLKMLLEEVIEEGKPDRVKKVSLFGSFARGEETPSSDVDLLIEGNDGLSLFDLAYIGEELEKKLGRKVDLVSRGGLDEAILSSIDREKITIYERT